MRRDFHASEKGLRCKASFAARVETCVRYKLSKLMGILFDRRAIELTKESAGKVSFCGDCGLRSCYGSFADCRAYATLGTIRKTLGWGNPPNAIRAGKPV